MANTIITMYGATWVLELWGNTLESILLSNHYAAVQNVILNVKYN